jgi:hypothetical protein
VGRVDSVVRDKNDLDRLVEAVRLSRKIGQTANPWLPEFIEIYIRDVLGIALSRGSSRNARHTKAIYGRRSRVGPARFA